MRHKIVLLLVLGLLPGTQSVEDPYSYDDGRLLDSSDMHPKAADDTYFDRITGRLAQKIWEKHESFDREELQALIEHAKEGRLYTPRKRHDVVFTD